MSNAKKLQFSYFLEDVQRTLGKTRWRLLIIWMSRTFCGLFLYRLERDLIIIFGEAYKYIRIPLTPIFFLLQAYSNIDIHYKSDILGGISILHPSLGIVISGQAVIGARLTLVGGNLIGSKKTCKVDEFVIGDDCHFGGNASLIGPLILGNHIQIGAQACVLDDFPESHQILIGVPATNYIRR
jgi:serine acetyltransferase